MKRWAHYFNDLFKKYDIWVILFAIGSIAFAFHRQKLFIEIPQTIRLLMVAFPGLVALANFGNIKKQANLLDACSIIFMFVYLYFSIVKPEGFSIMMTVVLFLQVCIRAFAYHSTEEVSTSPSKVFFSRLNYRFPLVPVVLVGFGLAFCARYVFDGLPNQAYREFNRAIGACTTLVPLVYLVCASIGTPKKLSFLDYMYVVLCCFILGLIFVYYPKKSAGYQLYDFIFPGLCLCLRAHNFDGEIITEKKKYFSALFAKFHVIFPVACGIAGTYIISRSTINDIYKLDQGVFLLIAGISCIVLIVVALCLKNLKASSIKAIDYVLLIPMSVVLFTVIYLLCITLGFYGDKVKTAVFGDTLSIVGIILLAVSLVVVAILFFIRHKYFLKNTDAPVELIENVEEPEENSQEPEEKEEETQEVEEEVVEQKEEEPQPVSEEPVQAEEPQQEETQEAEEEVVEQKEEEPQPVSEEPVQVEEPQQEETQEAEEAPVEVDSDEQNHPSFVVPEDESKNHLTKKKYLGRLMLSNNRVKYLYSEIKNYLASYGVKSRISNTKETFKKKGKVAVVRVAGKSLKVYLAVLPEPFIEEGYKVKDVSDVKQYADTPTLLKVKTNKSIKVFKEIVNVMMVSRDIKRKKKFVPVDYEQALIPNGEAILNSLGYSSRSIVPTINTKIIPNDMPQQLINYVPSVQGEPLPDNAVRTFVYLDTVCNNFDDGAIIRKEDLEAKKLIRAGQAVQIRARGTLDKRLTIYAEDFDEDSLKMIYITNGTAVIIKH